MSNSNSPYLDAVALLKETQEKLSDIAKLGGWEIAMVQHRVASLRDELEEKIEQVDIESKHRLLWGVPNPARLKKKVRSQNL